MKKFGKLLFCLTILPCLLYIFVCYSLWGFYWLKYYSIDRVDVVLWEDMMPVNISVPVRYESTETLFTKGCYLRDKNGLRFVFRTVTDDPDAFCITLSRWDFGGLVASSVKYKITDPEIEKQLIELFRTKPFEVLYQEIQLSGKN